MKEYKENITAREKGVKYEVPSGAIFFIRRGGMASWKQAIKDATDEVLGASYSFDYIDPHSDEKILCKAVSNYLVSGWENLKDENDVALPYSLSTARNLFEAEGLPYYALAVELFTASTEHERYLQILINEDSTYIKK